MIYFTSGKKISSTQWERPSVIQASGNSQQRESDLENFGRRVHISLDSNDEQNGSGSTIDNNDNRETNELDQTDSNTTEDATSSTNATSDQASSSNQNENPPEMTAAMSNNNEANNQQATNNSNNNTAKESDLPPNWSMQIAPSGRTFYIDHNKKTYVLFYFYYFEKFKFF